MEGDQPSHAIGKRTVNRVHAREAPVTNATLPLSVLVIAFSPRIDFAFRSSFRLVAGYRLNRQTGFLPRRPAAG
jgi:hypothetical protein